VFLLCCSESLIWPREASRMATPRVALGPGFFLHASGFCERVPKRSTWHHWSHCPRLRRTLALFVALPVVSARWTGRAGRLQWRLSVGIFRERVKAQGEVESWCCDCMAPLMHGPLLGQGELHFQGLTTASYASAGCERCTAGCRPRIWRLGLESAFVH
jgi:hypothetical protein